MKKQNQKLIWTLSLMLSANLAWAQIKPNVNKAESTLRNGKLDEAKAIIDATTESQEYMFNKKGEPTKNAIKAWLLKGIIYASIDTSKNAAYNNLVQNPFAVAKESFEKFQELTKGKKAEDILTDKLGMPISTKQALNSIAQAYVNRSIQLYQKEENDEVKKKQLMKHAFEDMEKAVYLIPGDTSLLLNAGVYMGPQVEEYDRALEYMDQYLKAGGKNRDVYIQQFSIYRDKKQNNQKALEIAQFLMKQYPGNPDYPRYALDIYVKTNRLPEAKTLMEKQAMANPKDKESLYFVGVICDEMKNPKEARTWYEKALSVDPTYYDPTAAIAQSLYNEVRELRSMRNNIAGKNDAENNKRKELYAEIKKKLEAALPYYQKLESMKPNEDSVLYGLLTIYGDLSNYDDKLYEQPIKKLKAKMKALGLDLD